MKVTKEFEVFITRRYEVFQRVTFVNNLSVEKISTGAIYKDEKLCYIFAELHEIVQQV